MEENKLIGGWLELPKPKLTPYEIYYGKRAGVDSPPTRNVHEYYFGVKK